MSNFLSPPAKPGDYRWFYLEKKFSCGFQRRNDEPEGYRYVYELAVRKLTSSGSPLPSKSHEIKKDYESFPTKYQSKGSCWFVVKNKN